MERKIQVRNDLTKEGFSFAILYTRGPNKGSWSRGIFLDTGSFKIETRRIQRRIQTEYRQNTGGQ